LGVFIRSTVVHAPRRPPPSLSFGVVGHWIKQPADIADSYDVIAHQWLKPHLSTNGIRQHEHALKFR
jgi:hypothetical protein